MRNSPSIWLCRATCQTSLLGAGLSQGTVLPTVGKQGLGDIHNRPSVHHFEKEGTVHGKNQGRSGRSPMVTGDGDKVEEVQESVCETPQTSTRCRSQELRMSRFTGVGPRLGSNCDLASKCRYVGRHLSTGWERVSSKACGVVLSS